MPLRQRKRLRLPGMAEVVGVALTIGTLVPAALWMRAQATSDWDLTTGTMTGVTVDHTHYNAEGTRLRVQCEYEYVVGQVNHRGAWAGFWPDTGSPNAMEVEQLGALQPGYPLTVFYDPGNPSSSELHAPGEYMAIVYAWIFATACILTGYYFFRIYPQIRAW